jgi:N-acyl homoserine lactone hydrolase
MKNYIIRPIPLCKGARDRTQLTYRQGTGEKVEICCNAWYLQGAKPEIIIDTGTTAEWYHAHGVSQQEHLQSIEDSLGRFDVRPEDIDIVILTHLHADHVEQARKFTRARFYIQKDELEASKHPAMETEYVKSLFAGLDFVVLDGDAPIIDGVRVVFTPGHTPGTQSVAVETSQGTAVISGFCSIEDNFGNEAKGLPVAAPGVYTNLLQAYDSIIKVKQTADILIPLHDMKYTHIDAIP